MRHPRRPRHRRDSAPAVRKRLRPRPQTALTLIQLTRQRPETLPDRILVDHDQAVLHNAAYSSTLLIDAS
ncbi:MAG: hypothetical protein LC790_08660, partial [Actinobacteria bacterium]|nr:hypothetical protein [Actinomycetota bacterium]